MIISTPSRLGMRSARNGTVVKKDTKDRTKLDLKLPIFFLLCCALSIDLAFKIFHWISASLNHLSFPPFLRLLLSEQPGVLTFDSFLSSPLSFA